MGAEASVQEVVERVKSFGPAYEKYIGIVTENGIDGSVISEITTEKMIEECILDLPGTEIVNKLHRIKILAAIKANSPAVFTPPSPSQSSKATMPQITTTTPTMPLLPPPPPTFSNQMVGEEVNFNCTFIENLLVLIYILRKTSSLCRKFSSVFASSQKPWQSHVRFKES